MNGARPVLDTRVLLWPRFERECLQIATSVQVRSTKHTCVVILGVTEMNCCFGGFHLYKHMNYGDCIAKPWFVCGYRGLSTVTVFPFFVLFVVAWFIFVK